MKKPKAKPEDDEPWDIVFYVDANDHAPAETWLDGLDDDVAARVLRVLDSVASAPPPQFAGGGMWHAMSGMMRGINEVRVKNGQSLHRLFCIVDRSGLDRPAIVVLTGMTKPERTGFSDAQYRPVAKLAEVYKASRPRAAVVRT